jgi:hypothetical protein
VATPAKRLRPSVPTPKALAGHPSCHSPARPANSPQRIPFPPSSPALNNILFCPAKTCFRDQRIKGGGSPGLSASTRRGPPPPPAARPSGQTPLFRGATPWGSAPNPAGAVGPRPRHENPKGAPPLGPNQEIGSGARPPPRRLRRHSGPWQPFRRHPRSDLGPQFPQIEPAPPLTDNRPIIGLATGRSPPLAQALSAELRGPAAAHRADIPAGVNITKVMLNFLQRRPSGGARFSPTQKPPPATPLFSRRDRREKTREPGGRESSLKNNQSNC